MVRRWSRERVLFVVNCGLFVFIVILLLDLGGISLPSVGKVRSLMDGEEPFCAVLYNDSKQVSVQELDLSRCCLEARAQLICSAATRELNGIRTDIVCLTGQGPISYHLNFKARQYCSEQVIWP